MEDSQKMEFASKEAAVAYASVNTPEGWTYEILDPPNLNHHL